MYTFFVLDVSVTPEVKSLSKNFREAAHELLELLDIQSPTVSRLKVNYIPL